jgi:hypothetical protein
MIKLFVLLFALFFSFTSKADTYPASYFWAYTFTSQGTACSANDPGPWGTGHYVPGHNGNSYCDYYMDNDYAGDTMIIIIDYSARCNSGGYLLGNSCVEAPACLSPTVRSPESPYGCITPIECPYPETDNGSGVCENITCPTGQNRSPTTHECQSPPTCASSENYDILTNLCFLKKLNCPGHTHANSANDQCLADPPSVCPVGQHDDGTYKCAADDVSACNSNQTSGYIFGVHQCINKPNHDQNNADAKVSNILFEAAQRSAQSASEALAANPTDTGLQAANSAAQSALSSAGFSAQAANANVANETATSEANSSDESAGFLDSINTRDQANTDQANADRAAGFGTAPTAETVGTSTVTVSGGVGSVAGSCPAPLTLSLSFRTITFSFDFICQFAESISALFVGLSWLGAAKIVFSNSGL